jgi:UDP-sugar transporter A1/2/3
MATSTPRKGGAGGWPATKKPAPSDAPPSILGIPIKWVSLFVITLQTALMVVLMRSSRRGEVDDEKSALYLTSVAVLCNELTKLVASTAIIAYQSGWDIGALRKTFADSLFTIEGLKMAIPASIYAMQNNLLYIALSNLEAAVFQVTYQLKILTTAVLSYFMLKRRLSRLQCVALLILFVGVVLVQLGESKVKGGGAAAAAAPQRGAGSLRGQAVGLVCVLISACSSGFAGVYFERVVKTTQTSVWVRNIQLGSFGAVAAAAAMFAHDGGDVLHGRMFRGFNVLTITIIAVQALGGLITAVVIKYADNILKGFATSISIVLATVASTYLFDFEVSLLFLLGALIVMAAVVLYSVASVRAKRKSKRRAERRDARHRAAVSESGRDFASPRSSVVSKSSLSSRKKAREQECRGGGDGAGGGDEGDNMV